MQLISPEYSGRGAGRPCVPEPGVSSSCRPPGTASGGAAGGHAGHEGSGSGSDVVHGRRLVWGQRTGVFNKHTMGFFVLFCLVCFSLFIVANVKHNQK